MVNDRDSFIFVLDKYGLLVEKGSVLGELLRKGQVIYWMPKNGDAANGGFLQLTCFAMFSGFWTGYPLVRDSPLIACAARG
jgi:hypothetical protein